MQYVSNFLINYRNYDYAYVYFSTIRSIYGLLRVSSFGKGRKIINIPSLAVLTLHRNVLCTPLSVAQINDATFIKQTLKQMIFLAIFLSVSVDIANLWFGI